MKKSAVILCIILLKAVVFGQDKDIFKLDWALDGVITGSVIGINAAGFLIEDKETAVMPGVLPLESVNSFDRWSAHKYSKPLDITGDALQYASMLLPAFLITTDMDQWLTIGVMYAEAACLSFGLKNLGKNIVVRYRPYTYFEGAPYEEDNDFQKSFPSGHTAMAFTGASFVSYVFSCYYPDSPWKIPVIAGSYVFAGATAAVRMASGNHFLSDVMAGAVIGSLSGILVPYMHKVEKNIHDSIMTNSNVDCTLSVNPSYCSVSFHF